MNKPFEQADNKQEKITTETFQKRTTEIVDDILTTNMKDSDFDLKNSKDKEFYEGMIGARKMVGNGLYKEPKFFAGTDGLRQPKFFETPEGILKWQLKNREESIEEAKKNHPDDWKDFVPQNEFGEIEELKKLLKFIESEQGGETEKKSAEKKDPQAENKQSKEKMEGEKLFQYQIENNSHSSAKSLKEDLTLFLRSIGDMRTNFQATKEELSEILYRNDLEYTENKKMEVKKEDKEILEPILNFRKELDKWNTLTEPKIDDFQKRILLYMKDVFGVEIQEPNEGEKYDSKNMQAVKVEETKNEFLDYKIKKIISPGFKINDQLFDYYKKWYIDKEQEMKKQWNSIEKTLSRQDFDKRTDEDLVWLKKHSFTKSIRPSRVEIYRYKV